MDNSGWNMYVFRDGRKTASGESVRGRLLQSIVRYADGPTDNTCLAALIAAGELECALADVNSGDAALAAEITDRLAEAFVHHSRVDANSLVASANSVR